MFDCKKFYSYVKYPNRQPEDDVQCYNVIYCREIFSTSHWNHYLMVPTFSTNTIIFQIIIKKAKCMCFYATHKFLCQIRRDKV